METICIEERKKVSLVGATKIISATATQAVVEVVDSNVIITGSNLEVVKLDLDNKEVNFTGNINSIKYASKTEKTPLLKRLFK